MHRFVHHILLIEFKRIYHSQNFKRCNLVKNTSQYTIEDYQTIIFRFIFFIGFYSRIDDLLRHSVVFPKYVAEFSFLEYFVIGPRLLFAITPPDLNALSFSNLLEIE